MTLPAAYRRKWLPPPEIWPIVAAMIVLGALLVPCCHSTIWSEESWTAWDASMANRISSGTPLYTQGMHVPLGPLAILEMVWLGTPSSWLAESAVTFITGCATILMFYAGLRRLRLNPTAAAIAAFAALPVRVGWMKMALYDDTAIFMAACVFFAAASLHRRWVENRRIPPAIPALMAALTALSLLSKYSIGLGLLGGTILFLAIAPRGARRWRPLAIYAVVLPFFFLVCCLIFTPWMSLGGFYTDVIATGSETKGGAGLMRAIVECISRNLGYGLIVFGLVALAVVGLSRRAAGPDSIPTESPNEELRMQWPIFIAALGGGMLAFLLEYFYRGLQATDPGQSLASCLAEGRRFMDVLVVGSFLTALVTLVLSARAWWNGRHGTEFARETDPALVGWFALILAPTYMAFCLSGGRWILSEPDSIAWLFKILPSTDPLDLLWIFGFAVLFSSIISATSRADPVWRRWLLVALAGATGFAAWSRAQDRVTLAREATQSWPEVAFLRGTQLRPASDGMRAVIAEVRKLAPRSTDRVLMLPEDPETAELFGRPRPDVAGGIIFFDMYRDALVEGDYSRLAANPPQVLLLGPSRSLGWGLFMFGPQHDSRGASRLIRRVESELLPARYRLAGTYPLYGHEGNDTMAVYQLQAPAESK